MCHVYYHFVYFNGNLERGVTGVKFYLIGVNCASRKFGKDIEKWVIVESNKI